MHLEFFQKQIDRLRSVYSAASLNDERVKVMWDRFKGVPNDKFESALNHLIGEFTTQALPSISRFAEVIAATPSTGGDNTHMNREEIQYNCEPCRDFGYGWVGDTVTQCTCAAGKLVGPEELARHQKHYNLGRQLFRNTKHMRGLIKDLPYDPKKREGA